MDGSHISAVDGFVLAMLGMMLLSGGIIFVMIICGLRNSANRDDGVDDLLEEMRQESATENAHVPESKAQPQPPEPWERKEDWWRK